MKNHTILRRLYGCVGEASSRRTIGFYREHFPTVSTLIFLYWSIPNSCLCRILQLTSGTQLDHVWLL